MKKVLTMLLMALLAVSLFAGGSSESSAAEDGTSVIDTLTIMYVPSRGSLKKLSRSQSLSRICSSRNFQLSTTQ